MNEFAQMLERRLAISFDFNLAHIIKYGDKEIVDTGDLVKNYHACGVTACILGHAQLIKNNANYSMSNLLDDLLEVSLPEDNEYFNNFQSALGYGSNKQFLQFWHKPIGKVTAQDAADLVRHVKLTKTIPATFGEIEKHYSAYVLSPPTKGILFFCKSSKFKNINGVGNSAEQAILDHSEQLIAYEDICNYEWLGN